MKHRDVDVIVVGGGHAGAEAALAAHRMGARVVLATHRFDRLGEMSCNPAIGGLGKGHLVREIDALDGLMGRAADARRHPVPAAQPQQGPGGPGPARAGRPRALPRGGAGGVPGAAGAAGDRGRGRRPDRRGRCGGGRGARRRRDAARRGGGPDHRHVPARGDPRRETQRARRGGPATRPRSASRAGSSELGLPLGRLKTGTPPRLDGTQHRLGPGRRGSRATPIRCCSPSCRGVRRCGRSPAASPRRTPGPTRSSATTCIARRSTAAASPRRARATARRSRTRSCASPSKDAHQVFLEPEGLDDTTVYPNGVSTSLPADVQEAYVRTIQGLENARIIRPGYAIEYDYVDPRALAPDARACSGCRVSTSPVRSTARPATRRRRRRGCSPG